MLDKIEDEDEKINMTDKDSKVMQHKDKRKLPSYNHQSAVDGKYGVTTSVDTKNKGDEPEDLFNLADKSNKNTEGQHKTEGLAPHIKAFLRHPFIRQRRRFKVSAGIVGPYELVHDADLHSCNNREA